MAHCYRPETGRAGQLTWVHQTPIAQSCRASGGSAIISRLASGGAHGVPYRRQATSVPTPSNIKPSAPQPEEGAHEATRNHHAARRRRGVAIRGGRAAATGASSVAGWINHAGIWYAPADGLCREPVATFDTSQASTCRYDRERLLDRPLTKEEKRDEKVKMQRLGWSV
jgi:hypothetical protein